MEEHKVVVIGAGITGLSAAYFLQKALPFETKVTILESSDRVGGVINSVRKEKVLMEAGPEAFVSFKPEVLALAQELGISDRIKCTNPKSRGSLIAHSGKMDEIPEGFVLFAPTRIGPWLRSNLLSSFGKLRMALDLILPRGRTETDESVANFVKRRLGREALEKLAQPLISAIYGGDTERLSSASVVPQMVELERTHRSVILGLLAKRQEQKKAKNTCAKVHHSLFMSFDNGMGVLVEALLKQLESGTLFLNRSVTRLVQKEQQWRIQCSNGDLILADAVIICTPSSIAAKILADADSDIAEELALIKAPLAMTVNLLFEQAAVEDQLDAFGFIVPESENSAIRACTFVSTKFPGRSTENTKLLRVFLNEQYRTRLWDKPDYEIAKVVTSSLRRYLQIKSLPIDFHVARHLNGIPEYNIGHSERVERVSARLRNLPGMYLAGNSYTGIGISECISSAKESARRVSDYFANIRSLEDMACPAEA